MCFGRIAENVEQQRPSFLNSFGFRRYGLKDCYLSLLYSILAVSFEMEQLQLITGLVVLISSSRYILLKIWPDFAKSSEAANRQVQLVF